MNPLVTLALRYLLGPLLIGIGSFFYGQHVGEAECQAKQTRAIVKVDKQADARLVVAQTADTQAATAEVIRQTTVRDIYHDVPSIVDRPVYSNVCTDADGVRLLSRAVEAANGGQAASGAIGDPSAVPSPAPAVKLADGHH